MEVQAAYRSVVTRQYVRYLSRPLVPGVYRHCIGDCERLNNRDKPATSRLRREESDEGVTMTGFQSSRSFHHVMSLGRSGSGLLKSGDVEDRTPYRVHSCESRPCPDRSFTSYGL